MNIVGISALYHDAAACLIKNGILCAAAQEERFTRIKADPSMPVNAFMYCLEEANLTIVDIDCIAYYEDPGKKLIRQTWSGQILTPEDFFEHSKENIELQIREVLGYEGPIYFVDHHVSHAASSYHFSGFEEAAILTVDGVGEWATTTYGTGKGPNIELFEEVNFPNSLGLLYSTITAFLGFGVNDGEYKVMGLAPYGKPIFTDQIFSLIKCTNSGQYELDLKYFDFIKNKSMFSSALPELLGLEVRKKDAEIFQVHKDIAKSLQVVLESVLIDKVNYLHTRTGGSNLCMAGGVALNCVANGAILKKGPFNNLFVQPAANDSGGALGAAAQVYVSLTGQSLRKKTLEHVYLGPSFSSYEIYRALQSTSLKFKDYRNNNEQLLKDTAQRLSEGKVIGWFQGKMEFGPRSLGARSILADPRNPDMRDRINAMVKKREGFRPFAPAILETEMHKHFDLDHISPFMLETCQVISGIDLPAITHVDGSARVQTVNKEINSRFAALLSHFNELTGCPILLNTSFNVKGEPIVCNVEDALKCFITTDIDSFIIEDFIIDRSDNFLETLEVILKAFDYNENKKGITDEVYTFI